MTVTNFTVKFDLFAAVTDGTDFGLDVDLAPLTGNVQFIPVTADHKPVLATGYSPRPAGVILRTISGYLDSDGQLKSGPNGDVGVRLLANDAVLELDSLSYQVKFRVQTASGEMVTVEGGFFEAPAADTVVNLTNVLSPTASTIAGVVRTTGYAEDIIDSGAVGRILLRCETIDDARAAILAASDYDSRLSDQRVWIVADNGDGTASI